MLDENLPTFFLKPSPDGLKHHESFYFTQRGTEPEATYALHHLDPAANAAKNTYAAALFDSHSPDILYGEVLSKPGWTQPTLSQDEIRKNGGVPPSPQPILPTEFAIQLYNPDQQIIIRQQTSKWSGTVWYEFSMPQTTFRTPSSSALDRSQNDPGADAATPQINFVWRKEGRIGKDMTCYLTGKSTDPTGKKAKKSKEPDIAVALFSGLKEMTIMESNLYRVDMEDYKGLEVVLLLGAAVIRDLFFNNARESFHIIDPTIRKNSGGLRGRKGSSPLEPGAIVPPVMTPQPPPQQPRPMQPAKGAAVNPLYNQPSRNDAKRTSLPPLRTGVQPTQRLDPRAQWEIDAETARLKAQVEAEERERKRVEEINRRARRKVDEEEARKTKKFLEQEDKERRRRQAEVDKETERLRKQFGDQSKLLPPAGPQQRYSAPLLQGPFQQPSRPPAQPIRPAQARPAQGPYLQPPTGPRPAASQSSFFSNGLPKPDGQAKMKKKSFWGLRSVSEQNSNTLRKKQSSIF
ncbi:uncharacterized protein BDR25DRAFT_302621 [Lindgomyces ingoldianus]|uniref:Uncharacterized protein n=1 Tax=Lindgomyces ingoldianus TaxID=673940 RepID=A0ACB6R0T6_9PLEO|nr:uncharacterized protein BDR25DRAFT_302621 [Lindgomyces ingoldianus]KAF2472433.1 hypothetical protein BDR25DRAFT_302621 [Lindgomyces ingoldianus]